MKGLTKLRHLHLHGLTPYLRASAIQDHLVRAQLNHKAAQTISPMTGPILITFQTPPTYTCGRREIGTLTDSQITHLRADGKAEFYEALRGGQTTFHGPGQLTAYLIISLQEYGLSTRSHVKLLEDAVIGTCKHYWLSTHTTENPGVWIGSQHDDRKIASVGVHLRRHIASHGIGLNVSVDLLWFDRIVACGLVGKRATNIEDEWKMLCGDMRTYSRPDQNQWIVSSGLSEKGDGLQPRFSVPISMEEVANVFANSVASRLPGLNSHDVDSVGEEEL